MKRILLPFLVLGAVYALHAQSLGNAGTLLGTVTDPSGAVVAGVIVEIRNPVTSYHARITSDATGAFRIANIPPNSYSLTAVAPGFSEYIQTVDVHAGLPQNLSVRLQLGTEVQTVNVQAAGVLIENEPSAHTDVDRNQLLNLPISDPGAGLSAAITYSTGGVAADANGFFHPLGDHGQVSFVVDGQPISDQQSKVFSTQLPANALQSMELITGSPDAEFGDKSSMVVSANTRSGLGAAKAFGNIQSDWGSFGNWGGNASLGFGNEKYGNFISIDGLRTGRFLDTPEFLPIHDAGNDQRIFDRLDYQPDGNNIFHLNLFAARNWFQVPNSYDQLTQDQRQRVLTWNVAPGYQHTFNANTLLTLNAFARRDQVNFYGSRDPFADAPVAVSQNRFLTNYGIKADLSRVQGRHDIKVGVQTQQTRLNERFTLGVTDPLVNAICLDSSGNPLELPGVLDPNSCTTANPTYAADPNLQPGLVPYDLTRGGGYFNFHGTANINEYSFYLQDRITLGKWTVNAGLRDDQYNGLTSANGIQPRLGLSYGFKSGTVFRAAYSRSFETPFNENLVLASGTGAGGLAQNVFGAASEQLLHPGNRNQFNAGVQQKIGRWAVVDADYFWKYTHNAYDFDVLFNTPISFPIEWRNSKIDGVTGRVSTVDIRGFQAYVTFGHTRARFFPPETGGLIPQSPLATSVFRIDHDQAFQQTANLRYQRPNNGDYLSLIWRYDSGLVDGSVPDIETALTLTAAQQAAIGFFCGNTFAAPGNPIASCMPGHAGATRVQIPPAGTENDDTNPPRIAPRNLFDLAVGTGNLLHSKEKQRVTVQFQVVNLTNNVALYNFLSTFSGTHFVQPRTYEAHLGYVF